MFAIMMALVCVGFASCGSDDDDGGGHPNKLVGTWTREVSSRVVQAIKFTADGKAYFNEYDKYNEQLNFDNVISPATPKVTETTIKISHPSEPGYYEEYSYVLSSDANSLTFTLIGYSKTNHGLDGIVWTRLE